MYGLNGRIRASGRGRPRDFAMAVLGFQLLEILCHFQLFFSVVDVVFLASTRLHRLILGQFTMLQSDLERVARHPVVRFVLFTKFIEQGVLFPGLRLSLLRQLLHVLQILLEDLHFVELVGVKVGVDLVQNLLHQYATRGSVALIQRLKVLGALLLFL